MQCSRSSVIPTTLALWLLLPDVAGATQVFPVGLETMTRESAVIARARVEDQIVRWDQGHQRILTLTQIRVLDGLKGTRKGAVHTVYQVGGTLDGVTFRIPGAITLRKGEEIVLFAARFGQMLVSYGMGLGKYVVITQGSQRLVTPEFGDVAFVKRDSNGGLTPTPRPDNTLETLSTFIGRIHSIVGATGGPQ